MKKIFVLLLTLVFIKAHSQTVDEIVQKYTNAAGGLDNFKKIKTAKFSGTASAQRTGISAHCADHKWQGYAYGCRSDGTNRYQCLQRW